MLAALRSEGAALSPARIQLEKSFGETRIAGLEMDRIPRWEWLAR